MLTVSSPLQEIEALEKPAVGTTDGVWPSPCLPDRASLDAGFAKALADRAISQCQDQSQLLEEVQRDLEVFKRAYHNAEREIHDLGESFEREKQALNDEIRQLKEHELHCREGRFESTHHPEILLTPLLT